MIEKRFPKLTVMLGKAFDSEVLREREREREREEREREREREKRDRDRDRERQRERERQTDRQTTDRQTDRQMESEGPLFTSTFIGVYAGYFFVFTLCTTEYTRSFLVGFDRWLNDKSSNCDRFSVNPTFIL